MTTVEQQAVAGPPAPPAAEVDRGAAQRAVTREFRPRRSVPAVIVAALLTAGATLVAIEVIAHLFDRSAGVLPVDRLARLGRETRWNDPLAFVAAAVAIALGLLLLWLAVWPGRVRALALAPGRPGVVIAASRSAVQRIAAQAAETIDGVDRARVRVGPRSIAVRADTPLRDPGDLADRVHRAVADRLEKLEPVRPPRVQVTARTRTDRSR